jgi:hypothetical protein
MFSSALFLFLPYSPSALHPSLLLSPSVLQSFSSSNSEQQVYAQNPKQQNSSTSIVSCTRPAAPNAALVLFFFCEGTSSPKMNFFLLLVPNELTGNHFSCA